MSGRRKPASPVLGAAMSVIGSASEGLVTQDSRFRHSFEAPIDRIRPDPEQPRKHFDEAEIAALAATMAAEGQLQPVLLRQDPEQRGHWILVAGERRWRAARHNGWPTLLAILHDGDAELAALLENLQRVDLAPAEEARGLRRLLSRRGLSQSQAADMLGRSPAEISATLRLLTLPEEFLAETSAIPRNVLVELARLEESPTRDRLIALARAGRLTVRAIREARVERPAPRPSSSPRPILSSATLRDWRAGLERRQAEGEPLSTAERRELQALRRQIEILLAFPDP